MIGWAIETLVATTLLMLLVLALRGPVRRAFGAGVAYLLWLLPVLRMALPPLPASWRESGAVPLPESFTPIARASDTITVLVVKPLGLGDAAASGAQHPSLGLVLAALWGVGAAAFFLWHWVAHLRFCRRMLARAVPSNTSAPGVAVIESDAAAGPLAFGVVRRYVAFPRDFADRYDADERDLALAHELGHHARGDLLANWAALVVLAIHWFNPVAWHAFRAFRADQEMANDARVLKGRDAAFRHAYGRAIVKSAHGGAISAACHLHTIHALKGRLKMLSSARKSKSRVVGGAAIVGTLIVTGLGLTASGTQAAEGLRVKVSKTIGVDLSRPVSMALAAPAASPRPLAIANAAPQDDTAPVATVDPDVPPAPPAPAAEPAPAAMPAMARPVPPAPPVAPIVDSKMIQAQVDAAMADMPEVSSANCGRADAKQMVIHDQSGGRNRIIICNDRIAMVAAKASGMAVNSAEIERNAYRSALAGLQTARSKVMSDQRLGAEERDQALRSIDESMKEMQDDLAHAGGDD
ncbi:M56 family metallopeptidase [Hephaestia mangrovi]|uniref:M56 family metallopeptidase n=1 Tax=Hephaestia mangrovi TaxID=2873268 RepID=UPI001CA62108|nr:M56 family metallopeptidase [Hephaestia mangrovi]MBY8827279.1 M56 family metallopeptidase [Hephaestia mangrovi]